ncbi:spartin-like isoform X1 [Saccostrea cucullata]|uniref:spartin-like isoform X1 n=1 Tax=Saccostrea cuccullata TaxID=36930 RepID=UPI002ED235CA
MAECQMERGSRGARPRPQRPPPINQSRDNITDLKSFQKLHDSAFKAINKGLALDEESNIPLALTNYQKGLEQIEKGLVINAENLKCSEDEKNEVKLMQQKMTKTKLQIEYRVQSLTQTRNGSMEVEAPPSYEESISSPGSVSDEAFISLGDSIMGDQSSDDTLSANAEEIFNIPDGVQIFYITPEGFVSAPSYPTSLRIFRFTDPPPAEDQNRPPAFLKVDNWMYPLVPGMSPALHATNGSYIFPDVTASSEGSSVGLILPPDATPRQRQQFEQTLASMTALLDQTTPTAPPLEQEPSAPPMQIEQEATHISTKGGVTVAESEVTVKEKTEEGTSTKIAKGITIASQWISWGLEKGSEKAGHYIKLGSEKLKGHLVPEQPKPVDPKLQKGAEYARKGAHVAVSVSSYVVTKLGQATVAVAREVAPHIRKQGQKLLPESVKSKAGASGSNPKVDKVIDGTVEVAASGLKGFGTVFMSLEAAAKALARNLANETVTVVSHKYGSEAAKLSENALYTVGNVAMTAYNVDNLGVKAIAKRAAKETGKELVKDIHKEWKDGSKNSSYQYSALKDQQEKRP